MKATINERGEVSIPVLLRREMHLEPGQDVVWEKVSANECRLMILPTKPARAADPMGALHFARLHGLEEGSADTYLQFLRDGEAAEKEAD